jgi:hypothetical protein
MPVGQGAVVPSSCFVSSSSEVSAFSSFLVSSRCYFVGSKRSPKYCFWRSSSPLPRLKSSSCRKSFLRDNILLTPGRDWPRLNQEPEASYTRLAGSATHFLDSSETPIILMTHSAVLGAVDLLELVPRCLYPQLDIASVKSVQKTALHQKRRFPFLVHESKSLTSWIIGTMVAVHCRGKKENNVSKMRIGWISCTESINNRNIRMSGRNLPEFANSGEMRTLS